MVRTEPGGSVCTELCKVQPAGMAERSASVNLTRVAGDGGGRMLSMFSSQLSIIGILRIWRASQEVTSQPDLGRPQNLPGNMVNMCKVNISCLFMSHHNLIFKSCPLSAW